MRTRTAPALVVLSLAFGLCGFGLFGCGGTSAPPEAMEESFESVAVDPDAEFSPLQYADGSQTLNDRCPIHQDRLNPALRPLFVNGKPVGFCGTVCLLAFLDGPGGYLDGLGVELASAMDLEKPAVLDAGHRVMVNYEVFFFASPEEVAKFDKDPTKYCGLLTDPVEKKRFQPVKNSPKAKFRKRTFYFLSAESRAAFISNPSDYGDPQFGLMAVDEAVDRPEGAS
jgi:YHS domain-containing protein